MVTLALAVLVTSTLLAVGMVTAALLDAVVVLAVLLMATVVPVAVLFRVHGRRGNHRGARHVRDASLRHSHQHSFFLITSPGL